MKVATVVVGDAWVHEFTRALIAERTAFSYEPRPYQEHAFKFEHTGERLQRLARAFPRAKVGWES